MKVSRIPSTGLCLLLSMALGSFRVVAETAVVLSSDTAVDTRAIDLTAPASGSSHALLVGVAFVMPCNAQPNSVKLHFDGSVSRELTLASSHETAGSHNLTFDSGDPTAGGAIASGDVIPDGFYTVTASYQDQVGDPPVSNASTNVLIDRTPPALTLPADISKQATGDSGATVSYPSATATDPFGVASLTYSKASGSVFPIGVTTVTVTARDVAGNTTVGSFAITVNGVQISVEQPAGTNLTDANPVPVNFGTLVAGGSKSLTFVIRNDGTLDLTGLSLSKAPGGMPGDFTIDGLPVTTLAPGAQTTFAVTFLPSAAGLRTATLLIANNDPDENPFEIYLSGTRYTAIEEWRLSYFGSPANAGAGADLEDGDADGLVNLLEFATASDPTTFSPSPGHLSKNGDNLEFTYARPTAAVGELTYSAETSATLNGDWIAVDPAATEVLSDDGQLQQVKVTIPAGSDGKLFLRLRVTRP